MYYKRLCRTLNNRGRLLPETDDIWNYIKDDVDYYQSVYKYNEEQYQEFLKTKSVKGVIDVVGSDLIWDFDSASDLEQARQDAFSLITRLLNYGIPENAIQIAFSGKKGFGVRVDTNNNLTPKQLRTLTNTIAQGLNYDTSVYNESRVMRVVGTKHNFHKDVLEFKLSTGFTLKEEEQKFYDKLKAGETEEVAFYKFPLTFRQLSTLTIPQILELARDINNAEIVSWETIDLTEELLQLCRIEEETQPANATPPSEDSDDPLERINWKDKPKFLSNCRWALQNGYFKPGADSDSPISGRSRALFVLATTYKNLGYSKKQTYYQLKSAADDCAANFGGEKFSKQEIMNNIVEPMYSAGHRGGQCSCKNPDSSELSQWLHKYCNSLGDHKCANDTSKRGFISIADMFAKFDDYVNHIEENTIKTGIDDLDEKIKLRIGQMVAIMGSPGSGKTSISLNILENTSNQGLLSIFYSLDMADSELCQKIAHKVTGLPEDEIFRIFQTNDPFKVEILKQISERYSNVKFSFDTGISAEQIEEDIAEFERIHDKKVKLIMVDYNELIAGPHSDPTANSGHIAAQLKKITNKGYLVISLLQPSKGYGDAGTEITTYRAAKGSSLLEQCFSTILAIHRPGFGCTDEEEDEDQYMVISALKNRMGKLAKINLKWDGARGLVSHLDEEGQELLKQLIDKKKALLEKDKDDWKN